MNALEERSIQCPWCGETIALLIDCTVAGQTYVEDCQVCCQPILLAVTVTNSDDIVVIANRENG